MLLCFLPIFIDISNFRLVLFGTYEPEAAVHLGYFVLGLAMALKTVMSLFRNRLVRSAGSRILLFLVLMPASLLFSDTNTFVAIQFLSVIVFFPFGVWSIKENIVFLFRFSMLCNSFLLTTYVVVNLILPEQFNPIIIYQGLVSFPASLTLYIYVLFCFLPMMKRKKNKFIFYLILVQIAMSAYIVLDAGRKAGLIDLLVLGCFISYAIVYFTLRRNGGQWFVKRKMAVIITVTSFPALYLCIKAFLNSNLLSRLDGARATGDIDGSRLENWSDGLITTFESPKNLFFGADISTMKDINFHNFVLDTSVRFGLPITIIIIGSLFLALKLIWVQVKDDQFYKMLLVAMFSSIALHSTINSAMSQSLYVASLVLALAAVIYCAAENFRWRKELRSDQNV